MPADFHFVRAFTLRAPRPTVAEVLADLAGYPRWWPQVRAVAALTDDSGLVVVRSVLPHDLELLLTRVHQGDDLLEVALEGALSGFARWRLAACVAGTEVVYEQTVSVQSGPLRLGASLARPLLVWNHEQMMRNGEQGLRALVEGHRPPRGP